MAEQQDSDGLKPCPFCKGPAVSVGGDYITCGAGWNPACPGHMVKTDEECWNARAAVNFTTLDEAFEQGVFGDPSPLPERQDSDGLVALRERVRDFIYDSTTDGCGIGWTLSAHQTDDLIAMVNEAMSRELVEKHEALTQMHDIARKALEGSGKQTA